MEKPTKIKKTWSNKDKTIEEIKKHDEEVETKRRDKKNKKKDLFIEMMNKWNRITQLNVDKRGKAMNETFKFDTDRDILVYKTEASLTKAMYDRMVLIFE